eukprot:1159766-Pelagomonas_calceolata.AAC.3
MPRLHSTEKCHVSIPALLGIIFNLCSCRMLGSHGPLLELGGHSHWVWRAQVSPMHDQLIASSSSDCLVNLFHTPEVRVLKV